MSQIARLIDRPLLTRALETAALYLMLRYVSGVMVVNWQAAASPGLIEALVAHGGVGGMQTQPFIVSPSDWTEPEPERVGTASVHRFLRRHARAEDVTPDDGSTGPVAAAPEAERCEPP